MFKVDLNADLGEGFGAYKMANEEEIIPLITSVNIACGYHAGDPLTMANAVNLAAEHGVCIGAHPSFPDLLGFGRRNMHCTHEEVKAYILYQLGALDAFCRSANVRLNHLKPHGALYNMAADDYKLSLAICEAILEFDSTLYLLALSGSQMIKAAKDLGVSTLSEVFADRAYEEDGTLVSRKKPGAMIDNEQEAILRVVKMVKESKVEAISGKEIDIKADSICVHGDTKNALNMIKNIRHALETNNITLIAK